MKKNALYMILGTVALSLAGCSGGGGAGAPTANTVSGVASAGLIKNGLSNVNVYSLSADGTPLSLLRTTSTDARGFYAASLGAYSGPVLVTVSGTYQDEATGAPITILPDKPLRAAIDKVSGDVTVSVTPLTEIAVQKAGTLTAANVKAANAVVSTQFGVDIIGTMPLEPVQSILATASTAEKAYTMELATISKMATATTADAVYAVIGTIKNDLATNSDSMSTGVKTQFNTALSGYLTGGRNLSGMNMSTVPAALLNVGSKTTVVNLALAGVTGQVYGVELILDLPEGVTIVADSSGLVANAVLSAASGSLNSANYTPASGSTPGKIHLGLVSSNGLGSGPFMSITCAVADGAATPSFTSSLIESGAKLVDIKGNTVAGATVTLSAN